jgi:hypothetical protein
LRAVEISSTGTRYSLALMRFPSVSQVVDDQAATRGRRGGTDSEFSSAEQQ